MMQFLDSRPWVLSKTSLNSYSNSNTAYFITLDTAFVKIDVSVLIMEGWYNEEKKFIQKFIQKWTMGIYPQNQEHTLHTVC